MKVKATVWDANNFDPPAGAHVFVDTNVWIAMHYEEASERGHDTKSAYTDVIGRILDNDGVLRWSSFSFPEVAHVIERHQFEKSREGDPNLRSKALRHEAPQVRLKVIQKTQAVWSAITASGQPLGGLEIDAAAIDDIVIDYRNWAVDAYDLFMIRSLQKDGLTFVLTDDKDFVTVPGIQVLTLDAKAIKAAKALDKLVA